MILKKKIILRISLVFKSKHRIYIFLSCISTVLVKGEQETSCPLTQPPAASLKIFLFSPLFLFPWEGRITALMWNVGLSLLFYSVAPGLFLHHGERSLSSAFIQLLSWSLCVGMKNLSSPSQHSKSWFVGKILPGHESKDQSECSVAFQ